MNYYSMLKTEADVTIKPLADDVGKLTREVAGIQKRLSEEQAAVVETQDALARLRATAGERVSTGAGDYLKYKTSLRKTEAMLSTAESAAKMLFEELLPAKTASLTAARQELERAWRAFAVAQQPQCEVEMSKLLAVVIAERDAYEGDMLRLGREYGIAYRAPVSPPRAESSRLRRQTVSKQHLLGLPTIGFAAQPAVTAATADATVTAPVTAPVDHLVDHPVELTPEAAPGTSTNVATAPASPDLDAAGPADHLAEVDAIEAEQESTLNAPAPAVAVATRKTLLEQESEKSLAGVTPA